jgi:lipoprotein signal peptidase
LFFFVAIDQLVKFLVPNPFKNYFFAFSLPVPTVIMYGIYFVVLSASIVWAEKHWRGETNLFKLAWVLIFAGAFANVGERIILGYVRDFIYISFFRWTGVYNLADGYIILGIIILILPISYKLKPKS